MMSRVYILVPAQAKAAEFLATFKDYPPSQHAASFSIDQIMDKIKKSPEAVSK